MNDENLSKGERKQLKRQEKRQQQDRENIQRAKRKRFTQIALWAIPVVIIIGIIWAIVAAPQRPEGDVVSRQGIHWHPSLSITINGAQREIPANIGLGGAHKDIHTHKVNDTLHVEMSRAVFKDDIRVKNFFDIWGERFSSECILDVCNGDGGIVKMLVNGEENLEFENYLMQDEDQIAIVYE